MSNVTDLTYLKSLIGDNPDHLREFIAIFLKQVPEEIDDITSALASGDFEQIGRTAHKMKSTVHNMGMEDAASHLKSIQITAQTDKDLAELKRLFEKVKEDCRKAVEELS